MKNQTYSPDEMYDSFWEPIILVRAGVIAYLNPAAGALFPQAKLGQAPEDLVRELGDLPSGPAVLEVRVAETDWVIRLQPAGDGRAMVFMRAPKTQAPLPLGNCVRQLLSRADGMSAVLQLAFPAQPPSEEKRLQYGALARAEGYRIQRQAHEMAFLTWEEYRPTPLDLAGLCKEVAQAIEGVCMTTGWRFTYQLEPDSLITVGDDVVLRRMMMALVTNAIKAVGTEQEFGMRLTQKDGHAKITVWDRGPGGIVQSLMDMQSEGPEALSLDPAKGAGTGRLAVAWAAKLHGGAYMTCDLPGGGTQAIVSLPIQRPDRGLPVRASWAPYSSDHFSPLLIELADVLPLSFYTPGAENRW